MDTKIMSVRERLWAEKLQACNESGLSRKEWCEQNGVKPASLYYWQNRIRARLAEQVVGGEPELTFVRLPDIITHEQTQSQSQPTDMPAPIYIHVGKMILEIHESVSARLINKVLEQVNAYAG